MDGNLNQSDEFAPPTGADSIANAVREVGGINHADFARPAGISEVRHCWIAPG